MYCTYVHTYYVNIHSFHLDIDECTLETDNCSQTCTNTVGGFNCGCNSGFVLDADGATCNGMYTNMYIYDWLCENQSYLLTFCFKK